MRLIIFFLSLIILQNCSFDNKSGIWKNENEITVKNDETFKDFKKLSTKNPTFNETIPFEGHIEFKLPAVKNNNNWADIFYEKSNNFDNFKYSDLNEVILKSKRISNVKTSDFLLYENDNIIISDYKGNILIYSVENNKLITKFNFYKNRYKNIKKSLNKIVEGKIVYVSDNIGYLYAFDYKNNKMLWAKNYKIPFKSNLKIFNQKLIAANQNNDLYFFNKKNGNLLKLIPTEETIVKNEFVNNISIDNNFSYFLNTYGSLYAIDNESMSIRWFLNLNQSLSINPSDIFNGNQIVNNGNVVVVTSNEFTYVIESRTGSIIYKKNFKSILKPIIMGQYVFLLSDRNLLIAMSLENGNILYSYNINEKIAEFLNSKKKSVEFKKMIIANNDIFIFLKNSYILKFKITGDLKTLTKLSNKLYTDPILIKGRLLYLNNKKRLIIVS